MSPDQEELLTLAKESLEAAKILLQNGYPGFATSRAYYAMFYVAEYYLEGEEMAFSKHSAVIAAFGQHFAHTGKVPVEFHDYLIKAQEWRHKGDYGSGHDVSFDDAKLQIERAEQFIKSVED